MAFVSVTLYLTVTNFLWGQLFRPQFFSISVPLIDICLPLLATANLLNHLRRQQLKPHQQYFFYFLIYTFANLILNIYLRHLNPIKPIFYFIRLSTLLSLFIWPINPQILNRKFYLFLNLILISNIIVGLIQYFLWPDFRSFSAQGWDPHLYRLVSTFFDPTFTALIYLLLLIQNFISHPNSQGATRAAFAYYRNNNWGFNRKHIPDIFCNSQGLPALFSSHPRICTGRINKTNYG